MSPNKVRFEINFPKKCLIILSQLDKVRFEIIFSKKLLNNLSQWDEGLQRVELHRIWVGILQQQKFKTNTTIKITTNTATNKKNN